MGMVAIFGVYILVDDLYLLCLLILIIEPTELAGMLIIGVRVLVLLFLNLRIVLILFVIIVQRFIRVFYRTCLILLSDRLHLRWQIRLLILIQSTLILLLLL